MPTGVTTPTTGSTTTGAVFDCATVPDVPAAAVPLDAPRGYNDVVFDLNGAMVGHDGQATFLSATDALNASPLAPESDTVYKMGRLSNGDIVAATSNNGIIRITPAGSVSTVLSTIRGYGLAVFHDDMIYVATNYTSGAQGIIRVDPDSGDWEILEDMSDTPRDIAFSRDWSTLYIGSADNGNVRALRLDANGDPTATSTVLVTLPQEWHDTVEVDACGNIYVGTVFSTSLFRIEPDMTFSEYITWTGGFSGNYGHGATWGDASGGWNEMAMYITHPYIGSRVSEVDVGVPGAHWGGTVVGAQTP